MLSSPAFQNGEKLGRASSFRETLQRVEIGLPQLLAGIDGRQEAIDRLDPAIFQSDQVVKSNGY